MGCVQEGEGDGDGVSEGKPPFESDEGEDDEEAAEDGECDE